MLKDQSKYNCLGIMSGTSLDGLDLALCEFEFNGKWDFKLLDSTTVCYPEDLLNRLKGAYSSSAEEIAILDSDIGRFMGQEANLFLRSSGSKVDLIASHGHTIFHNPTEGYTFQIGNGAEIACRTNTLTICDFRSVDVARGGQGAPLVPIGDELLFSEYDACLNLGGFANISFNNDKGKRIAYDICPVNFVLNRLSSRLGMDYDKGGLIAGTGKILTELFEELNRNKFFNLLPPKSLGQEWVEYNVFELLNQKENTEDLLRTYTEHIAYQLAMCFKDIQGEKVLVTGGGVYNDFLMARIRSMSNISMVIPTKELIEMKEALIFAFLGVLRFRNEENSLASVTGAVRNSINGAVYLP